jgi:biotin synthase-related radical SAM superfamily protein
MTSEHEQSEHGHDQSVEIILDGKEVISPNRRRTGLQIRELGPSDRINGFETQEVDKKGKKIRTIRDDEEIELHKDERFRTVPSEGGPGGST